MNFPGIIVNVQKRVGEKVVVDKHVVQLQHPLDEVRAWVASSGEMVECHRQDVNEDGLGLTLSKLEAQQQSLLLAVKQKLELTSEPSCQDLLEIDPCLSG